MFFFAKWLLHVTSRMFGPQTNKTVFLLFHEKIQQGEWEGFCSCEWFCTIFLSWWHYWFALHWLKRKHFYFKHFNFGNEFPMTLAYMKSPKSDQIYKSGCRTSVGKQPIAHWPNLACHLFLHSLQAKNGFYLKRKWAGHTLGSATGLSRGWVRSRPGQREVS